MGPFASLALITPMLLAADGVVPYSRPVAAVFVDVFVVAVVLLGGWFTGMWMRGGTELDRLHPGYSCRPSPVGWSPRPALSMSDRPGWPRFCSAGD